MNNHTAAVDVCTPHRKQFRVTIFLWAIPIITWLLLIALYGVDFTYQSSIKSMGMDSSKEIPIDKQSGYLSFSE